MGASWPQWALVMAGGALGAAGRFWLGGTLLRQFGDRMPWGTLAANLLGAFAIGVLAEWLQARGNRGLLAAVATRREELLAALPAVGSQNPEAN